MYRNPQEQEMELEREELMELSRAVRIKYNVDFSDYAQSSFKRRVIMVLKKHGIKTVAYLIQRIENDPEFFDQFLLDITVNTTELFRDPSFWVFFRSHVLPEFREKPDIQIWHAAASSGEEVLSMAILLKEEGLWDKARFYGTDINHKVLKRAAEARYPHRNLELFQSNYIAAGGKAQLSDYYTEKQGEIYFDKHLLKNVNFKLHDLALDESFFKFDIILCRNVMIYFNQNLQNKVFNLLHTSLYLGGYLCLGAKESLIWCRIADKFQTINDHEKIYRKIKA